MSGDKIASCFVQVSLAVYVAIVFVSVSCIDYTTDGDIILVMRVYEFAEVSTLVWCSLGASLIGTLIAARYLAHLK